MFPELNKIFVYVPEERVNEFKTTFGLLNEYKSKISFLGGTGEIMTNGEIFAINKTSELNSLKTLIGNTLTGTGADDLEVTTIIDFIQKVYEITLSNLEVIGDLNTGLIKSLNDLIIRVGITDANGLSKRISETELAINILNKTDGSDGSIKKIVDDSVENVYNTLLGTIYDDKNQNTIYGVKAYIDDLVDGYDMWEEYYTSSSSYE